MVNPVINPTPHINKILSHDNDMANDKTCKTEFPKSIDTTISIIMIIVIAVSIIIAIIKATKKDD